MLKVISFFLCNVWIAALCSTYDVVEYGAKPDGVTDSTSAFVSAWTNACNSNNDTASLHIPQGKFLLRSVAFEGPCTAKKILVSIDGTLLAPLDYRATAAAGYWLLFHHVNGLTISGGTLDGRGGSLWACKAQSSGCPTGARSLWFVSSQNVEINSVTSINSQMYHFSISGSRNVRVSGVTSSAPTQSPNTDGIHVQTSSFVMIKDSKFATGDDCVSIGPGTTNAWVENIVCGPGHGISIGSLGRDKVEPGVDNVTVKAVTMTNTLNGLRIKTWGKQSSGFARNIVFERASLENVGNPILIDQSYCQTTAKCPIRDSGVKISNVLYSGIHGTSATQVGVTLLCSRTNPCMGIKMEDINLTYKNGSASYSCSNAHGLDSLCLSTK